MIDSVVNLIDRTIGLLERRAKNDRDLFENHIEPLFSELSEVQLNYRKVFDDLEEILRADSEGEARAIKELERRRRELEHVREKIFTLAKVLRSKTELPQIAQLFFQSVCDYFSAPHEDGVYRQRISTEFTRLLTLLRAMEELGELTSQWQRLLEMQSAVRRVSQSVDVKWQHLLVLYANARVELLK